MGAASSAAAVQRTGGASEMQHFIECPEMQLLLGPQRRCDALEMIFVFFKISGLSFLLHFLLLRT